MKKGIMVTLEKSSVYCQSIATRDKFQAQFTLPASNTLKYQPLRILSNNGIRGYIKENYRNLLLKCILLNKTKHH